MPPTPVFRARNVESSNSSGMHHSSRGITDDFDSFSSPFFSGVSEKPSDPKDSASYFSLSLDRAQRATAPLPEERATSDESGSSVLFISKPEVKNKEQKGKKTLKKITPAFGQRKQRLKPQSSDSKSMASVYSLGINSNSLGSLTVADPREPEYVPPRFRLHHPQGFRVLKNSSALERSMRNYFRLPEAPSDSALRERKRVNKMLVLMEKDERKEQYIAGKSEGVVLDGFLLLNVAKATSPDEVEAVALQDSKLISAIPQDLSYFQNLFFLDVSENELPLEDLLVLGNLETLHMAYNKISSLSGLEELMEWQFTQKKSVVSEFAPPGMVVSEEVDYEHFLPRLMALNLSYNCIPAKELIYLSYFAGLQQLDLSGNQLRVLPTEISFLQNVTHLALENNKLTSSGKHGPDVFACLSGMPSLVQVNLNRNNISYVPPLNPTPGNPFFPALEVIGLAGNPLETVESVVELAVLHKTLRRVLLSDTPLSKKSRESFDAQTAFDQFVLLTYFEAMDAEEESANFVPESVVPQRFSSNSSPLEDHEGEGEWQNESWSPLIPHDSDEAEEKLDIHSAAAAAAAEAAAERRNEDEKKVNGDMKFFNGELQSVGDAFFNSNIDYSEEGQKECLKNETENESDQNSPGLGVAHFASPEDYLAAYTVELVYQEFQMPQKGTRDFLSCPTGHKDLVTIPELSEFMDIYRLVGGKRARFMKQELNRKHREGASHVRPLKLRSKILDQRIIPCDEEASLNSPSTPEGPTNVSPVTQTSGFGVEIGNVFLTALDERGKTHSEYSNKSAEKSQKGFSGELRGRSKQDKSVGGSSVNRVLPSVCPVTLNVHGAMTELRALLRKPLPSLPFNEPHFAMPKQAKTK